MIRQVAISDEQVAAIEEMGIELLRREDLRASKLLAVVLAWRYAPSAALRSVSGEQLAEVVALDGYSRKVGA